MNGYTPMERVLGSIPVNVVCRGMAIGAAVFWWYGELSGWWILPTLCLMIESDAALGVMVQSRTIGQHRRRRSFRSPPVDGRETIRDASFWVRRVGHPTICWPIMILSAVLVAGTCVTAYERQALPSSEHGAYALAAFGVLIGCLCLSRLRRRWLNGSHYDASRRRPDLNATVAVLTPAFEGSEVREAMSRLPANLQALIHEGPVIEGEVTGRTHY